MLGAAIQRTRRKLEMSLPISNLMKRHPVWPDRLVNVHLPERFFKILLTLRLFRSVFLSGYARGVHWTLLLLKVGP